MRKSGFGVAGIASMALAWAPACGDTSGGAAFDDSAGGSSGSGGGLATGGAAGNGGNSGASNSGGNAGSGGTAAGSGGGGNAGDGGTGGSSGDGGSGGSAGGGAGGMPQSCSSGDDCEEALPHCEPLQSRCVECFADDQCSNDERCVDNQCEPACSEDADCDGSRDHCQQSRGVCVECTTADHCDENQNCVAGACLDYTPCANSLDCVGIGVCDLGTGQCAECVRPADCQDTQTCVSGACVESCDSDLTCTPLGLLCDFDSATCVECLRHTDCPSDAHCSQGSCVTDDCSAGAMRCAANVVEACDAHGVAYQPLEVCESEQSCVVSDGGAACEDWICTPGASECQSNRVAIECAADGLSVVDTIDCEQDNQYCLNGQCSDRLCEPDALFCSGSDIHLCASDGLDSTLNTDCAAEQYCDGSTETPACRDWVCIPNEPVCDEDRATACNQMGSGLLDGGVVCTGSQLCLAGVCEDVICEPNSYRCSGNTSYLCSANGVSETPTECQSDEFCSVSTGQCAAQVCTPNEPVCIDNRATACNSNGSDVVDDGTNCTGDQTCVAGICEDHVCEPGQARCQGNTRMVCSPNGLTEQALPCADNEYCDSESATCEPQICQPNQPSCDGNVATTCNANGSGYLGGGSDCGAETCVSGSCEDAYFVESFEDGNYDGWVLGLGSYTRSVTSAFAADDSAHSLTQTGGGSSHYDGLYHTFPDIQPTYISYWARPTEQPDATTYFVLSASSTPAITNQIAFIYFNAGSILVAGPSVTLASFSANQWYHIEMDIDWTAKNIDFSVNGQLVASNVAFRATAAASIARLDLYHYSSSVGYWDEIVIR